jgi:starvation-inducible DNA-binding protein
MLGELLADEQVLLGHLRAAHTLCDEAADIATASLIENWIGDSERRHWFLNQTLNS